MIARVSAIAAMVGAITAPIVLSTNAEVTLLSAESLLGSDSAIVVGGTGMPTPSDGFAQSAENLYLDPLGFDGGATNSAVCDMSGTDPCSATLQVLTTPETTQWDQSMATGAQDITSAVEAELGTGAFSAAHPLTVFAYSQGATDASLAMSQLAQAGVPSGDVHFVFIGDPSDNGGILNNLQPDLDAIFGSSITNWLLGEFDVQNVIGKTTPSDLYGTTEYMLDGDGFANFQKDYNNGGVSDAVAGMLNQHREYMGLTPAQIADATAAEHGDITKFDISDADVNNAAALADAGEFGTPTGFFESSLGQFLENFNSFVNEF